MRYISIICKGLKFPIYKKEQTLLSLRNIKMNEAKNQRATCRNSSKTVEIIAIAIYCYTRLSSSCLFVTLYSHLPNTGFLQVIVFYIWSLRLSQWLTSFILIGSWIQAMQMLSPKEFRWYTFPDRNEKKNWYREDNACSLQGSKIHQQMSSLKTW